jgi:hypothetical protein
MIGALVISLLLSGAGDPESKELAAKSFAEGEAAFARRQFTAAALAFERAGRLVPHPSAWLNASEAWERAGDLVRAAEGCDRVIELAEVRARFFSEAKKRLARIEPKIARIDVSGAPEHRVRIDGGEARRAPFSKRVLPGAHRIVWTAPDGEHAMELELGPGDSQAISLDVEPQDEAPPLEAIQETPTSTPAVAATPPPVEVEPEPPTEPSTEPEPAIEPSFGPPPAQSWVAFGAGGVAFGVGLTFGGLTIAAKNDFNATPTPATADDFFDRRRTANIAYAAAAVSVLVGVGLWILDDLAL